MMLIDAMFIHALSRVSTRGFFKAPLGVWGVCRKLFIAQLKQGTNDAIAYHVYSCFTSGFNARIFLSPFRGLGCL
ncbi:hypothetical protein BZG02_02665 [Labilibaculum filiforme]|uniref:Uncharacterized protein n=1 Tax=Labilibaculum filiforme TaxID=1940526 RepID=A0A2N3I6G9_9BACT|nr:hypothetical protein BZG02_02665 [Labilibaculum filiforme]